MAGKSAKIRQKPWERGLFRSSPRWRQYCAVQSLGQDKHSLYRRLKRKCGPTPPPIPDIVLGTEFLLYGQHCRVHFSLR